MSELKYIKCMCCDQNATKVIDSKNDWPVIGFCAEHVNEVLIAYVAYEKGDKRAFYKMIKKKEDAGIKL